MRIDMASGNYLLQQHQAGLAARIKGLINSDLKEICKAYNYQVSGNKSVLQSRCLEVLQNIVREGDGTKFGDLEYRVNNHGRAPPHGHTTSSWASPYGQVNGNSRLYQQTSSSPKPSVPSNSRYVPTGRYFKSSPFYDVLETALSLHDLPDMPQNRHTVNATLVLSADQAQRLRDDKSVRLLLYCGSATGMSTHTPSDIAFPNQLEVKINSDDFKHNFKGLKNKPGSTKPADITDKIRKNANYQNQISVTYALTTKRFSFTVCLVRHISAESLIERIKTGKVIPKQTVLDEMNRANADTEIAATSVRMSLKDPISTVRITVPVRSTVCTHNQCFDGAMFLQLQEQAPQWSCPVCSKAVPFESLCVDKYFEDILKRTATSIEKVIIEPNGEWTVIKEEEDTQPSASSRKRPRASYDDDFDDDEELVEVLDPDTRPTNGFAPMVRPTMPPSVTGASYPMNTPPASSREPSVAQSAASVPAQRPSNKRASSAVIDLTLSDDDEPPRPAKRQSTGTNPSMRHGNPSLPLHLPPPLPPPPDSRSSHRHSGHTDLYRPSHSSERTPSIGRNTPSEQGGLAHAATHDESFRHGHSTSPTLYNHANTSFTSYGNQHVSRPSTSTGSGRGNGPRFSGFSIRGSTHPDVGLQGQPAASAPAAPPAPSQQQHNTSENLMLPIMPGQTPGGYYDGWRGGEYGNYSSSPSG